MRRHIPVLVFLSAALMAPAGKFTSYVNPFIGTGAVEGGLSGNNYPGAPAINFRQAPKHEASA